MQQRYKTVCLIVGGLSERTIRLQPWRYLHEIARQLIAHGHHVTIISDHPSAETNETLEGVPVRRVASVRQFRGRTNQELYTLVQRLDPDIVLWNVGVTSAMHQKFRLSDRATHIGVFTSPIYTPAEVARVGIRKLVQGYKLSAIHVLGTLLPDYLLGQALNSGVLKQLVVQTRATRQRLLDRGICAGRVGVIAPGIDMAWMEHKVGGSDIRSSLGYQASDTVVLYFGSPAPLRGLHSLIEAIHIARHSDPSLRLLVLSRRRADELLNEDAHLRHLLEQQGDVPTVQVVSGFLHEDALVQHVDACDIVALPFDLIPSDAPLSLLEAQALGKPVVTTALGCLPELIENGPGYVAQPANPESLAHALLEASSDLRTTKLHGTQDTQSVPARRWEEMGNEWSDLLQHL